MSTADVLPLGDLDTRDRYEIVDGERVEMPPMSAKSSVVAARLARVVSNFGVEHDLGEAYPEVLFKLPLPVDRNRRAMSTTTSATRTRGPSQGARTTNDGDDMPVTLADLARVPSPHEAKRKIGCEAGPDAAV